MRRLVLASDNAGKLREFAAVLAPLAVDVVAQRALGVAPAEEPHLTFVENALAKARHAAAATGLPALADDSGLCCAALNGLPGVRSARFAGPNATDEANNQKLISELANLPAEARNAFYVCVLVFVRSAEDPTPVVVEGRWHGSIVDQPAGVYGCGDSIR